MQEIWDHLNNSISYSLKTLILYKDCCTEKVPLFMQNLLYVMRQVCEQSCPIWPHGPVVGKVSVVASGKFYSWPGVYLGTNLRQFDSRALCLESAAAPMCKLVFEGCVMSEGLWGLGRQSSTLFSWPSPSHSSGWLGVEQDVLGLPITS